MNHTTKTEYEKLIFESLTDFPVSIKDLHIKLNKPVITLSKYLELLEAKELIRMVKIGNAKCYLKKKTIDITPEEILA